MALYLSGVFTDGMYPDCIARERGRPVVKFKDEQVVSQALQSKETIDLTAGVGSIDITLSLGKPNTWGSD